MTTLLTILAASVFVPLFPMSMPFNLLLARLRHPWLRALLLLIWPQFGILILSTSAMQLPDWVAPWALGTAALYALRALVLRDLGLWTGFIATSAWALLWPAMAGGMAASSLAGHALVLTFPLVLLTLLAAELVQRFGAAYTGLYGGLVSSLPRLAWTLVFVVLAVTAVPVFPGFAALIDVLVVTTPGMPLVGTALVAVWVVWSWAGVRLLQGLVIGTPDTEDVADLSVQALLGYGAALAGLAVAGVYLIGRLA